MSPQTPTTSRSAEPDAVQQAERGRLLLEKRIARIEASNAALVKELEESGVDSDLQLRQKDAIIAELRAATILSRTSIVGDVQNLEGLQAKLAQAHEDNKCLEANLKLKSQAIQDKDAIIKELRERLKSVVSDDQRAKGHLQLQHDNNVLRSQNEELVSLASPLDPTAPSFTMDPTKSIAQVASSAPPKKKSSGRLYMEMYLGPPAPQPPPPPAPSPREMSTTEKGALKRKRSTSLNLRRGKPRRNMESEVETLGSARAEE